MVILFYLSRRSDAPPLRLKDSVRNISRLSKYIEKAFSTIAKFTYHPNFVARLDDEMNLEYLNVTLVPDSWQAVTLDKCQAVLADDKFCNEIDFLGWIVFTSAYFSSLPPSSYFCEYSVPCVDKDEQNELERRIEDVIPDQYIKRLTDSKILPSDKFLTVLLFGDRHKTERTLRNLVDNDAQAFSMDASMRNAFYNGKDLAAILIGIPHSTYESLRPLRKWELE